MVPSSVAKIKEAAPEAAPFLTTKSEELLKTIPVGVLAPETPVGSGTVTTKAWGAPVPSYSVAFPVPLSAIRQRRWG
jgi:hypothetical protein